MNKFLLLACLPLMAACADGPLAPGPEVNTHGPVVASSVPAPIVRGGVSVFLFSPTVVAVHWNPLSSDHTRFVLQRRVRAGATWGKWKTVARTDAVTMQFWDYGVVQGTYLRYRVRACNTDGCSRWRRSFVLFVP